MNSTFMKYLLNKRSEPFGGSSQLEAWIGLIADKKDAWKDSQLRLINTSDTLSLSMAKHRRVVVDVTTSSTSP